MSFGHSLTSCCLRSSHPLPILTNGLILVKMMSSQMKSSKRKIVRSSLNCIRSSDLSCSEELRERLKKVFCQKSRCISTSASLKCKNQFTDNCWKNRRSTRAAPPVITKTFWFNWGKSVTTHICSTASSQQMRRSLEITWSNLAVKCNFWTNSWKRARRTTVKL